MLITELTRRISGPPTPEGVRANVAVDRATALAHLDAEAAALARELPAFFTVDAYDRHLVRNQEVRP